jgi:glucose/arabinose dehydrogenase
MRWILKSLAAAALLPLAACGDNAVLPADASYGPSPALPAPRPELFPTYNVPATVGWKAGEAPTPGAGLMVKEFARDLTHPRWLLVLPNGDVLVAESNHKVQWADTMGFGGWLPSLVQRISARFAPDSPNRITLLRDRDHDGVAETRSVFLEGLNAPFGMALVGDTLYVANTGSLMAYPYQAGETRITAPGRKVTDLPEGPIDHHWTKNVIASRDGGKLYVTIGSNSNAGENGMEAERDRAMIWEVDPATGSHRVFASGIRNPNGMGWTADGVLWTVSNERDGRSGDLVPDYLTAVKEGGFYGWPYSYYGRHVDQEVQPQNPQMVAKAIAPDYALGTHTASLGLAFATGQGLGPAYADGVFVGQHGSWNRKPANGYRVIFVPFRNNKPVGKPVEVLGGFLNSDGKARGRPVGVTIDGGGALLVADDGGNKIWRVTAAPP